MKHSHYHKPIPPGATHIDVYRVLAMFGVTDPCLQHAVKKLLVTGQRGVKNAEQDVQEAIDTLVRWQDMRKEEAKEVAAQDGSAWRAQPWAMWDQPPGGAQGATNEVAPQIQPLKSAAELVTAQPGRYPLFKTSEDEAREAFEKAEAEAREMVRRTITEGLALQDATYGQAQGFSQPPQFTPNDEQRRDIAKRGTADLAVRARPIERPIVNAPPAHLRRRDDWPELQG